MEFAEQRNQTSNFSGLAAVVVLHVVLGYALLNGLGHKVVEVFNKPLGVSLIEEVKPLPPPPPPPPELKKILPQPKVVTPPPAYVPPPEVVVQPAPQPNVIVATTSVPTPPVEVVAKPTAPAIVAVGVACPNHVDVRSSVVFPPQAQRMGLSGDVTVELLVSEDGRVSDIHVVKSSNAVFNDAALSAVNKLRCNGVGRAVRVRVPFSFVLDR
ncbi:MAG: energy transducer TonB [Burkholderiaceae bacterium]